MTISTRIALGISTAALSLSLALAPAAFAQDPMSQDLEFRNSLSRYDGAKNPVKKDDGTKRYGTSK
jgi:pentapeptide MXKDX repeat protein